MTMTKMPAVTTMSDGATIWAHRFEHFSATVYVPACDLPWDIINYGFKAPYLLVFGEKEYDFAEAVCFAKEKGFEEIAHRYATSVVFIYPTCDGGWEKADTELYKELIGESKNHQYFKDGCVTMRNRFTGEWEGFFIRGGIYHAYLYGFGASADYIAQNLLTKIEGQGLWGTADVAPTVVTLCNLTKPAKCERRDMPVVSVGNSAAVNKALAAATDHLLISESENFTEDFDKFVVRYRRWGWTGDLQDEPYVSELGLIEEPGFATVKTSPDNCGDDKGTSEHKVGYVAYYNKGIMDDGRKVPLLLCFHGGGDSAFYIAYQSEWYDVCHKHDFLLVCIENHLNSTATEMMELIEHLKAKYNIDSERIYASGFSMGGCKSWDMFQEYPGVFAGLAPMDATFEVGLNVFGKPAPGEINGDTPVPVFYAGGEETPLPELPFQAQKCTDRIENLFAVNRIVKPYAARFEAQETWENKIWGVSGDKQIKIYDEDRDATLTLELFKNENGIYSVVLGSVSGQGHECRHHTCEMAYRYLSQFRRLKDGTLLGGENTEDVWNS